MLVLRKSQCKLRKIRGISQIIPSISENFSAKCKKLYHCGASSKDAGNKIATIVQLDDIEGYRPMFEELWAQVEK